jgi:hypothetical protein
LRAVDSGALLRRRRQSVTALSYHVCSLCFSYPQETG